MVLSALSLFFRALSLSSSHYSAKAISHHFLLHYSLTPLHCFFGAPFSSPHPASACYLMISSGAMLSAPHCYPLFSWSQAIHSPPHFFFYHLIYPFIPLPLYFSCYFPHINSFPLLFPYLLFTPPFLSPDFTYDCLVPGIFPNHFFCLFLLFLHVLSCPLRHSSLSTLTPLSTNGDM